MPITGPSSYLPTTTEFIEHWAAATAALPPTEPLVLEGGVTAGTFSNKRSDLLVERANLEAKDLDAVLARGALEIAKEALLAQLNLFNSLVRGAMGSSVYGRALPKVPGIGDGREAFSKPMVQAVNLWAKINAAPPPGVTAPVLLADGTAQAVFATAVAALTGLYDAVTEEEQGFALLLEARNDTQDELYAMMKAYRVAVLGRFLPGDAIIDSLPALTADSGRTPDPVELSGAWVAGLSAAQLTATVSNDPDLKEYELRWCAGASYAQDTEHVAGSIPAGTVPVFVTTKGLTVGGSVASFRVYVRLLSGGEAGSETVVVERP